MDPSGHLRRQLGQGHAPQLADRGGSGSLTLWGPLSSLAPLLRAGIRSHFDEQTQGSTLPGPSPNKRMVADFGSR